MNNIVTKALIGLTLGATALTVAAPAEAQRYRHHRDRDHAGAAVAAGVVGLVVGAAIASSGRDRYYDGYRGHDRRYNYDRRYYQNRGYYPRNGYHYREYQRRGWRGCTVRRVYDPYLGRRVSVRYC